MSQINYETVIEGAQSIRKEGSLKRFLAKAQAPEYVNTALAKMSPESQAQFYAEFDQRSKSIGKAYVAWVCLGTHYSYLRRWFIQFLFWIVNFVGFFTLGPMGIVWWALIDPVRIFFIIKRYNRKVAFEILRDMKAVGSV